MFQEAPLISNKILSTNLHLHGAGFFPQSNGLLLGAISRAFFPMALSLCKRSSVYYANVPFSFVTAHCL